MNKENISRRAFLFGRKVALDESGATAIEYGLIAAVIGASLVVSARALGFNTKERFRCIARKVQGKPIGGACKKVGIN